MKHCPSTNSTGACEGSLMAKLARPAEMKSLRELLEFISVCARETEISEKSIRKLELAAEEALVNIFRYAYPEGSTGILEVNCDTDVEDRMIVEFMDRGVPFDYGSLSEPDVHSGLEQRKIGGLGFLLMKKMVDEVDYRRDGEVNVLRFTLAK